DDAIAARRPAREAPVLVGERDREAVDLRLGYEAKLARADVERAQAVVQSRLPGAELLGPAGVGEREHRHGVAHLLEALQRPHPPGHSLRGAVGRAELRVLLL